ncbi:MAG TPA: NrfD/PsrC family molybdoenzyme membrane anchor subunit [Woeseiaceae bacterium]|nr:NrfD/PsrC family molybdoenzyme membrane anchor subunit [Woeseiaceae bacterium]
MSEHELAPVASPRGDAVLAPGQTFATVEAQIAASVLAGSRRLWLVGIAGFFAVSLLFFYSVTYVFAVGVGVMGVNIPVAWGFPIANVVWWIGIGHAGTLISAILLLLRQKWRTSINRFAEAMTIFAAGIAGLFPIIHLGRPWFAYWIVPYPSNMGVWPQWRSPLVWDLFAIATYIIVSILFWYVGLIPDLATLRDRSTRRWQQVFYGSLCLGWRGSALHWRRHQMAYLILAGLATPLVVSVHSVIALDFAVTIVPGYHSTVFPPYFVAGALFSGFAMVITIAAPLRAWFHLERLITPRHFDNMAKVMLAAGLIVIYGYAIEYFMAWYSGDPFARYILIRRALGAYAPAFWVMLACNVLLVQTLWLRRVRRNVWLLFAVALLVNVGMWSERFVIVLSSPHRDYLPSAWDVSFGTNWDYAMLVGSIGFFFFLMFLFIRWLPAVSISEVKELVREQREAE